MKPGTANSAGNLDERQYLKQTEEVTDQARGTGPPAEQPGSLRYPWP